MPLCHQLHSRIKRYYLVGFCFYSATPPGSSPLFLAFEKQNCIVFVGSKAHSSHHALIMQLSASKLCHKGFSSCTQKLFCSSTPASPVAGLVLATLHPRIAAVVVMKGTATATLSCLSGTLLLKQPYFSVNIELSPQDATCSTSF